MASSQEFIVDQEDIGIPTELGEKIHGGSNHSMVSEKIVIKNFYFFWCSWSQENGRQLSLILLINVLLRSTFCHLSDPGLCYLDL